MDTNASAPAPRRRRTASPTASPESTATPPVDAAGPDATLAGAAPGGPAGLDEDGLVRSGVSMPEATLASLQLSRGAIGRLDAEQVSVTMGAIGAARADTLEVQRGAVGAAMSNELTVTQGAVGTVLAGNARLDQSIARVLVARHVVVERPSIVGVLVARRVSGDVRVLLDWRGALILGAVLGLIARVGRGRR